MRGIAVAASRFADIHQRATVEYHHILFLCVASLLRHHDSRRCFTASSWNVITCECKRGFAVGVSRSADIHQRGIVELHHVLFLCVASLLRHHEIDTMTTWMEFRGGALNSRNDTYRCQMTNAYFAD